MVQRIPAGSTFLGYIPAGTVVTQQLIDQMMQGLGARQPFDLDLKANNPKNLEVQSNGVRKG